MTAHPRKPVYVVPMTIDGGPNGKPCKISVPIYGNFKSPWTAQQAAIRKMEWLDELRTRRTVRIAEQRKYAHHLVKIKSEWFSGDRHVDWPRRLDGQPMEEWGID